MKKIRTHLKKMKQGFLTAKIEEQFSAYIITSYILIHLGFTILCYISAIIYNKSEIVGIWSFTISIILYLNFTFWDKANWKIMIISIKTLDHFFGRYGPVVTKADWKRIKKENRYAYKLIWDKKNIGHCYYIAWLLALRLEDAKIMYCSITSKEGGKTAHAVVYKNNCIYDTNKRRHHDYDEYIEIHEVEVYKIFEEEVYCKMSFFDDVRQDFINWCVERDVYCDPQ